MDDGDYAAMAADKHLKKCLAAARPVNNRNPSLSICEECGEPIPAARQIAAPGCTRCVDCQEIFEYGV